MSDEIVDLTARRKAKTAEMDALRYKLEAMQDAKGPIHEAIQQAREICTDEEVVTILRNAIEVLES